ncbi:uncharacterized protein [Lepeophtheirus salmonis]|uniref:uncharacterized protein isoform X1 n=1 Tax=Lepeophtheirus salmonis TaxID=72036 RepID=UPI001AE96D68|nr:uncharacterized protein LOC121120597 isoform X1 [Lepeophtheirus salmonis]
MTSKNWLRILLPILLISFLSKDNCCNAAETTEAISEDITTQSWIQRMKDHNNDENQTRNKNKLTAKIEGLFDLKDEEEYGLEEDLLDSGSDHVPVYFKGGPLGKGVRRSSYDHLFRSPNTPPTIVSSLNSDHHIKKRNAQTKPINISKTYIARDLVLPSTLMPYIPPTSFPIYGSIFRSRHLTNDYDEIGSGTPLYATSSSPTTDSFNIDNIPEDNAYPSDLLLDSSLSNSNNIVPPKVLPLENNEGLQGNSQRIIRYEYTNDHSGEDDTVKDLDTEFWKNKDTFSQPISSLTSSSSSSSFDKVHSKGVKTGYFPPKQRVMPRVSHMEAECSDDIMKLRVQFNSSFTGLIYSAGYAYDTNCIYVNGTGDSIYEFYIQLNRCGTLGGSDHKKKRDTTYKNTEPTKNVMWNTVTIQYSPLIEEEWDEHFKVTCEYGYDFWKTVTFPFLDVEVNTADPVHFSLNPPECHMEIRQGYGTSGHRITGPVHVGDPLTLLIYMRSEYDGFDILVNDCYAHNGANKKIQLIDHHGCPVDEKLISRFQGNWGMNNAMYETVIYAHMKTFRFTGTPALYIECDIRMCHGKCPTQSCNWKNLNGNHLRRKRALEEEIDQESIILSEESTNNNSSLSERFNLFQAIHVLQSRDENEKINETESELGDSDQSTRAKDSTCLSSNFFTVVVGILTFVSVTFGVAVSILYIRLKKEYQLPRGTSRASYAAT